jgi:hypothetical protein
MFTIGKKFKFKITNLPPDSTIYQHIYIVMGEIKPGCWWGKTKDYETTNNKGSAVFWLQPEYIEFID